MQLAGRQIHSSQRSHHIRLALVGVGGSLGVRQNHMLQVFPQRLLFNYATPVITDFSVQKAVALGNKRHKISLTVKMERSFLVDLNQPDYRRANRLQFGKRLLDSGGLRKMAKSPNHWIRSVHAPSRHQHRQKIAGGLDLKRVVEKLVLNGIVLVEIQESILAKEVRHREEIKVEGVVADHQPVHRQRPQKQSLRSGGDAKSALAGFDAAKEMGVGTSSADPGHQLGNGDQGLSLDRLSVEALIIHNPEMDFLNFIVDHF